MKSLWPLLAVLAFAAPARSQGNPIETPNDVAPPGDGGEEAPPAEAKAEEAPAEEAPAEEAAAAEEPAPPAEGEPGEGSMEVKAEPPPREEPVVNVKVAAPPPDEEPADDEDGIAVAKEPTKVTPTAEISKPKKPMGRKKEAPGKAAKTAKASKDKVVTPKPKAVEPKAPSVPAIPLTPIAPRNP